VALPDHNCHSNTGTGHWLYSSNTQAIWRCVGVKPEWAWLLPVKNRIQWLLTAMRDVSGPEISASGTPSVNVSQEEEEKQ